MSVEKMTVLECKNFTLAVDFGAGEITSLILGGSERINARIPIFSARVRDLSGNGEIIDAYCAKNCTLTENGAVYEGFDKALRSVAVYVKEENGDAVWSIEVVPQSDGICVEYVDFPLINLPALVANNEQGNGGRILYPYNEGAIVSDMELRENSWFNHSDAEYPSKGSYSVFPNMVCSQMLAYLWENVGLYIGTHDAKRGVKEIDFVKGEGGITLRFRIFCGTNFGETFKTDYPIVFSAVGGNWESAAEKYRAWFENSLPEGAMKISRNENIPAWYEDSPLVITYPVRGTHDMDEMKPNRLYPYTNAMPLLKDISEACNSKLLVLLMHWEGTAPWAPPYVWPPFGSEENFNEFKRSLHENGDLLGVYCSGFGYTIQSNLIENYNKEAEYASRELWKGMCAGPDGKVAISNICTGQRKGYDICPASEVGEALLEEAYLPLLKSELDYVQILDQNHGGSQYFCYSKEHGHPPVPGPWMTQRMQKMLKKWNDAAPQTLFGCESASAEPFIGNLMFSDNRFELNYRIGAPVPLYAYIYHEYLRNFMGNQVCCPFPETEDTLRYRLAYSFSIGDCMTLVLSDDGKLAAHWGTRDFDNRPDREKAFLLISNLMKFYRESAKPYLYSGRMICTPAVDVPMVDVPITGGGESFAFPSVYATAWEAEDGSKALILVNPNENEACCTVNGKTVCVAPLNGQIVYL